MNTHTVQETLWSLLNGIKFGMLTHRHTNGELHSHPLTTQNKSGDEGNALYFFISRKSEMAIRIQQDSNVNVSYAHPGTDTYVSVSGQGELIEDQTKKDYLFTSMAKAWFPGGATDPDLALLKINIGHAEYWDISDSKMVQLAKRAKAAVTGEQPKNMAEHKEINLS